jgi:rare lipoprotein A
MYLVKSLPFGSKVKVTNKKNGHAVTVTITDRGPYVKGRCIDLSKAGAGALGFAGLAIVTFQLRQNHDASRLAQLALFYDAFVQL